MTDQNSWPDASKPGVPLNPEQDGWHWVDGRTHGLHALKWSSMWRGSAYGWWHGSTSADTPSEFATLRDLRYLGPCHTPAEVAAMLAAQEASAQDTARIAVAADLRSQAERLGDAWSATRQMLADRLLGGHAVDALDAMLAEAERRGMERAAGIAEGWHGDTPNAHAKIDWAARKVAAAIRAAMDPPA
jgi:hypothetical protein